jgi:hypothetical protein
MALRCDVSMYLQIVLNMSCVRSGTRRGEMSLEESHRAVYPEQAGKRP